jgi:Mrp family chromosome partitioning ATPase
VELRDLRIALRRHWLVAVSAFLVCVLVGAYVAYSADKTYEASATLTVEPDPTTSQGGQGGTQIANFLIPTVVRELRSSPYRDAARAQLDEDTADDRVKISSSVETGTGIIDVTVEAKQADTAVAWANALATVADQRADAEESFIDVRVIQPATGAKVSTGGDQLALMIASVVLGLLAAVFVALIASRTRRALDPTVEARQRLHLPVLATIPRIRALRRRALRPLMSSKSIPDLEEAFRQLRTAVELNLVRERPDVIAITSYVAGEGKTTVTVGLGEALASVGHDVVLVDADLRRPALHTALGVTMAGDGLADWARHDRHPELRRSDIEQLGYLPAGTPDRHPADVTAIALSRALAAYRQPGRLILLDAPPIHGVAETPLILDAASHIIVVVDASSSRMPELGALLDELQSRGIRILGTVVNRARKRRGDKQEYYAFVAPRRAERTNGQASLPPPPVPTPQSPTRTTN